MIFNTKRQKASWFVWRSPQIAVSNVGTWPRIQNKVFLVKASHAKLLTIIVLYTYVNRLVSWTVVHVCSSPFVSYYIWNETRVVFIFLLFNCFAWTTRKPRVCRDGSILRQCGAIAPHAFFFFYFIFIIEKTVDSKMREQLSPSSVNHL